MTEPAEPPPDTPPNTPPDPPPDPAPLDRLWAMPTGDLIHFFDRAMVGINRHTAAAIRSIRELEGRAVPKRAGAASTAVWIRNRHHVTLATARRLVKAAAALDAAPPTLQNAVDAGRVNLDQAVVITRTLAALPGHLGPDGHALAAKELTRYSATLDPTQLTAVGNQILGMVAPEIAEENDRRALERAEARAKRDRHLTITPDPSGTGYRLTGHLTDEAAAILRAVLHPLCSPATSNRTDTAEATDNSYNGAEPPGQHSPAENLSPAHGTDPTPDPAPTPVPEPTAGPTGTPALATSRGPADTRTPGQRRADALVEVCRIALNTTKLPRNGGDRPQLVVNIDYDILKQQLGAGTLDNGDRITPETARRIACDCRLLPAVLNGSGQPLNLGRTKRLVNGALRRALVIRDRGCTFPGCDRGPRWTDAHHIVSWASGGPTSLENTALLCGFHHGVIHQPNGWTIQLAADGRPVFIPPPDVDPSQKPQRNHYHVRR